MNSPLGLNSWTRLLPVSATQTLPSGSIAMPCGRANWPLPDAGGAELAQEFAFGVELLDAVVAGVGDPDVAFGVGGCAAGAESWPAPEPSPPNLRTNSLAV